MKTGFTDLDSMLDGGLQKGCLYALAGRSSMGPAGAIELGFEPRFIIFGNILIRC